MLTNERLQELSKLNGLEVADTLTPNEALSMARELLTLREATAPSRAEVDECFQNYNGNYTREQMCDVPRLESITRTAILACEKEKQRAGEAVARYDRFVTEWFEENTDFERLVDAADSHVDPDCWLSTECRRIHETFLKRFEEQQNGRRED